MTLETAKESLKQTLAKDFDDFFEQIYTIVAATSKKRDDFMFQQGRYNNLKQQMKMGMVSSENANMSMNQIRFALQETIKELKTKDVELEETPNHPPPLFTGLSELEKEGLQKRATMLQEKLNYLQTAEITAIDPTTKWSLQKQIEDLEQQLAEINQKLSQL